MSKKSIPHYTTQSQTQSRPDGLHYNPAIKEYEVWLDGQVVNYATHQSTAWFMYNDAIATKRLHSLRCPSDSMAVA